MSTPETNDDVSRPTPEEPPAAKTRAAAFSERKRRRRERREAAEVAEGAEAAPPMTRREMRARGILLTTEVPVVEAPPDWPAQAGAGDAGAPADATEPAFDAEPEAQAPEAVTTASVAAVGAAPGNAPMTRRQMRALTGEIGRVTQAQAVPAPEASETPGEAATPAEETPSSAPEAEAAPEAAPEAEAVPEADAAAETETEPSTEPEPEAEAEAEGQEAAPSAAVPSRRAMRDRLRDAPPPSAEAPAERTVTGRRPVVRTPVTARGVRTVDESGVISAVQPVVPPPVAWAPTGEQPTVPPQPAVAPVPEWTTSPSSWESAVSMPAIVMGIEDRKEPPTGGLPITPPRTELADSALPSVSRQSLMAGSRAEPGRSRGLPGTAGRPQAPEATAAWSSLIDEQEASARRDEQEASVRRAAEALAVAEQEAAAAPATRRAAQQSAAEGGQRRERRSGRDAEQGAEERPGRGLLRIAILVAIGLAIGALIYLLATGALGSLFAEGAGTPASGVAVAGLLAGGARLTKEFRDR